MGLRSTGAKVEDEPRLRDGRQRYLDSSLGRQDPQMPLGNAIEHAHENTLSENRLREFELGLLPYESDVVTFAVKRAFDSGRSDFKMVGVGYEIRDIERGAEVASNARAKIEIDCRILGRHALLVRASLLDQDRKHPTAAFRLEFYVDALPAVRKHDRLDDAEKRLFV